MTSGADNLSSMSMFDLFQTEVEQQASVLNEGLLAIEEDPTAKDNLERLMRAAHSVKGAARIIGLDPVVKVAHAMEDCFVAAQNDQIVIQPEHADILLKGTDILQHMAQAGETELTAWSEEHQEEITALITQLGEITSGKNPVVKPVTPVAEPDRLKPELQTSTDASVVPPSGGHSEQQERAVRISSDILTRLIGFVGETVIQARALEPYCKSLDTSLKHHRELMDLLHHLQTIQETQNLSKPLEDLLSRIGRVGTECTEELFGRINELTVYAQRLSDVSERLYTEALSSRMRPFGDGTTGFPRMVRDLARQLDKKVKFEIHGKDTGVDRDIIDRLESPLTHLLRNALDHGIETPAERVAAGKSPEGHLRLEARHHAGRLLLSIADDGRGLAVERIREKVIAKEMIKEDLARQLTDTELFEFLFLPGFSTAEQVSEISGRGVGMDAVQHVMQEMGGTIRTESEQGKGTRFLLELPVTRSVIRALLVTIAGEPYAFPLGRTDYLLSIKQDEIQTLEGRPFITHAGRSIGLIEARQVLELSGETTEQTDWPVVVISDRHAEYALKVDAFCGEREFVVKPLDPRLGSVPDVSAVSIMEDGSPVFILDVDDLVRSTDNLLSGRKLQRIGSGAGKAQETGPLRILVADDSITVRETERRLLEGYGYELDVAVDGMDAWNQLQIEPYDLLVSDIDMPRMNGIELVEHIRQDAALQELPIMLVSYKDREADKLRGMEAGANYYFTKSGFQNEAFLEAVVDLIGEART